MKGVGLGDVVKRVPEWESEFWSYISQSDGTRCPLYSDCHVRLLGEWCPNDNRERIEQLLDSKEYSLNNFDFLACGDCGGILKMVETLSCKYLEAAGVYQPPVPDVLISQFDKACSIEHRTVPLKAHHGAVWRLKDGWVIHLNKDEPAVFQRFTLFHEAFHILLHLNSTPLFRKKRGTQEHREAPFNELLANYFAVSILMPRRWVVEKWTEVKDVGKMAELFNVPESAMGFRLRHMCLI